MRRRWRTGLDTRSSGKGSDSSRSTKWAACGPYFPPRVPYGPVDLIHLPEELGPRVVRDLRDERALLPQLHETVEPDRGVLVRRVRQNRSARLVRLPPEPHHLHQGVVELVVDPDPAGLELRTDPADVEVQVKRWYRRL